VPYLSSQCLRPIGANLSCFSHTDLELHLDLDLNLDQIPLSTGAILPNMGPE